MTPETIRKSSLKVIVDGEVGRIRMKGNNYSTDVKTRGMRIITPGEYLLMAPEDIEMMVLRKLDTDYEGRFKIEYH